MKKAKAPLKKPQKDARAPKRPDELEEAELDQASGGTQATDAIRVFKATSDKRESGGENVK